MKPRLIWAPEAYEDLLDIYVFIGVDNVDAAERVYSAIEQRVGTLIEYPRLGVRRPEIAPSARMLVDGSYLVLYETRPDSDEGMIDEIEVVRIVDGRRDLRQLF